MNILSLTSAQSDCHLIMNLTRHILIPILFAFHSSPDCSNIYCFSQVICPTHYSSEDTTQVHTSLGNKRRGLHVLFQFPFHIPHDLKNIYLEFKNIFNVNTLKYIFIQLNSSLYPRKKSIHPYTLFSFYIPFHLLS